MLIPSELPVPFGAHHPRAPAANAGNQLQSDTKVAAWAAEQQQQQQQQQQREKPPPEEDLSDRVQALLKHLGAICEYPLSFCQDLPLFFGCCGVVCVLPLLSLTGGGFFSSHGGRAGGIGAH